MGRLTWRRAAGVGAVIGAWIGMMESVRLGMAAPETGSALLLALSGLAYWALFGAVFALAVYATTRGCRDFISHQHLVAGRNDTHAGPDVAEEAENHRVKQAGAPPDSRRHRLSEPTPRPGRRHREEHRRR